MKEAVTKADHAFAAFMASPRLTDEAPLVTAYQDAWQNYRNQGLAPLIDAAEAHDVAKFNALIPESPASTASTRSFSTRSFPSTRITPKAERECEQQFRLRPGDHCRYRQPVCGGDCRRQPADEALCFCAGKPGARALQPDCGGQAGVPVPVKGSAHNEIDHLMSSMEQMRQALLATIAQVRDASHTVTHAAQEIASGNIDLASRTESRLSD